MSNTKIKLKNGEGFIKTDASESDYLVLNTRGGAGTITVNNGTNTFNIKSKLDAQNINGGYGNDTFVISTKSLTGVTINGGTSQTTGDVAITARIAGAGESSTTALNGAGYSGKTFITYTGTLPNNTTFSDMKFAIAARPTSATSFNQVTTILDQSSSSLRDTIKFTKSGDFSTGLNFTNIEKIELSDGVTVRLSAAQISANNTSLKVGPISPATQFYGTSGGKTETVYVQLWSEAPADDDDDGPTAIIVDPLVGKSYYNVAFQLDDFHLGTLGHNGIKFVYDAHYGTGLELNSYARFDGAQDSETYYGVEGADNVDGRLGDDTIITSGGNDFIKGQGGADKIYSGNGNDLIQIGSFGSGVAGTSSKGDDGLAEWVSGDYVNGGSGFDILRITAGIGATNASDGTLILNNSNIVNIEKIEVGATISKDSDESQYQFQTDENWRLNKDGTVSDTAVDKGGKPGNSINNVVIDATGVSNKGLIFEGNKNIQTFKGTTQDDIFIGNGGVDDLDGGAGADKFVYQTIRTYASDGVAGTINYTATDRALLSSDADLIKNFVSGVDKIEFRVEATPALEDTFDSLVSLTKGNLTNANVSIGTSGLAIDADDFIIVDTDFAGGAKVYYDADGNGGGAAIEIAQLIGVSSVTASDFSLAFVSNF